MMKALRRLMGRPAVENLRPSNFTDVGRLLEIDQACFDKFLPEGTSLQGASGMLTVMEKDGVVIGYIGICTIDFRDLRITDIAVDPKHQGHGVGRKFLTKAIESAASVGLEKLSALVPESNLGALEFFKACGFMAMDVYPGCYESRDCDGILMVRAVPRMKS